MTALVFGSPEAAEVLDADRKVRQIDRALLCKCGGEPEMRTIPYPEGFVMHHVRCKKCRICIMSDYDSCEIAPALWLDAGDAVEAWNDFVEVML